MGHMIEQIALERGHEIVSIIDIDNRGDFASEAFRSADVAIEFTTPQTAYDNYLQAFAAGVKVVSGSTGWIPEHGEEVRRLCREEGHTLFWSSNFSLGVAIFGAVNRYLARIMSGFPAYDVKMEEVHHVHKLDAPSGTALALADSMNEALGNAYHYTYDRSGRREERDPKEIGISAVRGGNIVGEHEVIFAGTDEVIEFKHTAYSKAVFGKGAVQAAKFLAGREPGLYDMQDVIAANA